MITIAACPKAFDGHIGIIQWNAIRSWSCIAEGTPIDVILLGDERGTESVAARLDVAHEPEIETNQHGTPTVRSILETAEEYSSNEYLCYINADIILPPEFPKVGHSILDRKPSAVVVGRRVNMKVCRRLDFSDDWWPKFEEKARHQGKVAPHDAIDYFLFPKGAFGEIPPFAIGRFGWDNWLLYRARSRGHPIVDVTKRLKVVHQNHEYLGEHSESRIQEIQENRKLLTRDSDDSDRHGRLYTLLDADMQLTSTGRLTPNRSPYRIWRALIEASEECDVLKPIVTVLKTLREAQRSIN